jgi:NIPSNAP
MATTIQLRRYDLVPGERDAFLAWWRERVLPVRKAHGFEVVFAYLVPETDEFIWAVSHDGDADEFRRAEDEYVQAPDREAAFAGIPERVRALTTHLVEVIPV